MLVGGSGGDADGAGVGSRSGEERVLSMLENECEGY